MRSILAGTIGLLALTLLPGAAFAFEAADTAAPSGSAAFADPDVSLGLESPDEGNVAAEGPQSSGIFGGSLQIYGDDSTPPPSSGGVAIPGQLP